MIAPKGSGKTTLAVRLIQSLDRCIVFDFLGEDGYALACDDIVIGSPRELWGAVHNDRFSVSYRPRVYDPKTLSCPGFDQVCKLAYRRGDTWLVIDEAHQICRPHNIPVDLLTIARLGRHRQVSCLYITQSFTAVERTLTSQTDTFLFFRVVDPTDLEGIRQRCGKVIAEEVQNLRRLDPKNGVPGQVKLWSDRGQNVTLEANSEIMRDHLKLFSLTNPIPRGRIGAVTESTPAHDECSTANSAGTSHRLWFEGKRDSPDNGPDPDRTSAEKSPEIPPDHTI